MSTRSTGPPRPQTSQPVDMPEPAGLLPSETTDATAPDATTSDAYLEQTLRVTIAAQAEHVPELRHAVRRFVEQHRVVRPIDVALAVSEACANVVLHAYADQAPGPLHVTGFAEEHLVYVTVADEGPGLTPRLDSPGLGLGLSIIARCSDHFQITGRVPNGTVLTMGFAYFSAPPSEWEAYAQVREDLAAALHDGAGLDAVEARIERAPLTSEARDALWLAAWATVDRRRQRSGSGDRRAP